MSIAGITARISRITEVLRHPSIVAFIKTGEEELEHVIADAETIPDRLRDLIERKAAEAEVHKAVIAVQAEALKVLRDTITTAESMAHHVAQVVADHTAAPAAGA